MASCCRCSEFPVPPPLRLANPNPSRAEGERFENIGSAAHTPIKKNGCTTVDGGGDFRKAFNRPASLAVAFRYCGVTKNHA
jgi:hypothetical protein